MLWGGNRKKLCFQVWRQWAALKQGKRESLHVALQHWQHLYLVQAFAFWREYSHRAQVPWTMQLGHCLVCCCRCVCQYVACTDRDISAAA